MMTGSSQLFLEPGSLVMIRATPTILALVLPLTIPNGVALAAGAKACRLRLPVLRPSSASDAVDRFSVMLAT